MSLKTELWRCRAWAPRVFRAPRSGIPGGWSRAVVAAIRAGVWLHNPRKEKRGCLSPRSSHIRWTPPLPGVANAARGLPGGASNQPSPTAHAPGGPVQLPALLVFQQLGRGQIRTQLCARKAGKTPGFQSSGSKWDADSRLAAGLKGSW